MNRRKDLSSKIRIGKKDSFLKLSLNYSFAARITLPEETLPLFLKMSDKDLTYGTNF
jgi:hypothetical protein